MKIQNKMMKQKVILIYTIKNLKTMVITKQMKVMVQIIMIMIEMCISII